MAHKGGKLGRANCKSAREQRRKEAEARQAIYDALTLKQRIEQLDQRYGPGKGAKRERTRIKWQMRNLPG